ncbi:hypothetical protein PJL18_02781 [Paenarthrobacter nicotinovorans]|nr:hypothetical protein [Paenarthrobacter nicotinovorans]
MGNKEPGTPFDGFIDNGQGGIHGKEDFGHRGRGSPDNQADFVPILGEGLGPEFFNSQQHLAEGRFAAGPNCFFVFCFVIFDGIRIRNASVHCFHIPILHYRAGSGSPGHLCSCPVP